MPTTFTLTSDQRAEFEARGVLRLPGFHGLDTVAPMAAAIWADLTARLGMARGRPETWTTPMPAHFQALTGRGVFNALGSPDLRRLANALLGEGAWDEPRLWGQPLVTLPTPRPVLPRPSWHFDLPGAAYQPPLPGLRVFTVLEPLGPGGGGTLVVTGSHRLALDLTRAAGPISSPVLRKTLRAADPWLTAVIDAATDQVGALMAAPAVVGGIPLAVEQITGEPGDLILMHPLMLHGVAHNGSDRVRMMVTSTVWRKALV